MRWARIENFRAMEFVVEDPDGRYHPDLIWAPCGEDVDYGWAATKADEIWSFSPYVPTDAESSASNSALLQRYTQLATAQKSALTNRIGVINDGIELGEATPAEIAELPVRQAQLIEWKRYALYLGRVTSQEGWALIAVWPVQPTEGMDLTVSSVAPSSPQLQ